MATVAGLVQQRQQIGVAKKSLKVQQELLNEQSRANSLLESQISRAEQAELDRKREKLIDLWTSEFKHRGKSPLEANNQALTEMEILDLISHFKTVSEKYQEECRIAELLIKPTYPNRIPKKIKFIWKITAALALLIYGIAWGQTNPDEPVTRLNISASLPPIFTLMILLGFLALIGISIVCGYFILLSFDDEGTISEKEVIAALEGPNLAYAQKLEGIKSALKKLPASELSDDSEFRKIINNLLKDLPPVSEGK
jgi:hypothetical protein